MESVHSNTCQALQKYRMPKGLKMDNSPRIVFIWFDCKGNCSVCGSPSSPLDLFTPSVPAPGTLCFHLQLLPDVCHRPAQEVPLRQWPLPCRWLRCRCGISTSAWTSRLAVAGHRTLATASPYKNCESLFFLASSIPSILKKLRSAPCRLSPPGLNSELVHMYKSADGFGGCWFFSLEILSRLCSLERCRNSEYVSAT